MADRQPDSPAPQRRFTDRPDGSASVIGRGLVVKGTFSGTTDLEVWGAFEGDIDIEGLVRLRPGGRLTGGVTATDLVVEGDLRGTVTATSKVDMRATCRVEADVSAARVAAAEGSRIEGRITVTGTADEVVGYSERRRES